MRGDVAVFCDAVTQRLHRVTVGRAQAVGVTPDLDGAVLRWAGLEIDPSGSFVLAVQEDHRGSGGCLDALVRLDLGGDNRDGGSVLFSEADFVSAPRPSADWSRLAFVTWNHPNMPWHETTLWVGDLDDRGNLTGVRSVANGCAWTDPGWLPDGRLLCSGDRSGWWNLYAFDVAGSSPEPVSLLPRDADYGRAEWLLGHTTRAVLSDGRVVAERIERGSGRYEIIDLASGEGQPMDDDLRVDCTSRSGGVVAAGDDVVIYSGFVDRPPMLVRVDLRTGRRRVVRDSSGTRSMPRLVSVAEQVSWRSVDGSTAYGHLYPPRNSDLHGLRGERPPLIVTCHGGPTSMAYGTFSPSNAFWTSRGFALLDVNYAGSSGFGRAYRERLDGQWGVADVGDVITGVSALADRGLVDRRRVAIMGASAGGFLALAALTFSETFTAGVSWFGIGDLELLARGTHKFEAHYLDRLVGPYPETATLYRARSPIHHLDRLTCPMLLLQGLDDRVVPPNQAEDMAAAVRAKVFRSP